MDATTETRDMRQHRRAPLPRAGGNQWYRNKSIRESRTLCGAPCGYYDIPYRGIAVAWTRDDGARIEPCADCAAALAKARGESKP